MSAPKASIWAVAPEPGIPELPALLSDSENLWLAYVVAPSTDERFAVVRFSGVIDHRLSPINDEGLGKHPYAKAGLQWYSFNELTDSEEINRWTALRARHWVVTFKDNTLEVVAAKAEVIVASIPSKDSLAALLAVVVGGAAQQGAPADVPASRPRG
jgi:hypothetical protein